MGPVCFLAPGPLPRAPAFRSLECRSLTSIGTKLQNIVLEGLFKFEKGLRNQKNPKDLRHVLLTIAVGRMDKQPFPEELIAEIRADLRLALLGAGFGDGLPQEGDVEQPFEVRLIQALLVAFEDPDHYFCHWWARGVRLGSAKRKFPRTPAVFERKTRWRKYEELDTLHAG